MGVTVALSHWDGRFCQRDADDVTESAAAVFGFGLGVILDESLLAFFFCLDISALKLEFTCQLTLLTAVLTALFLPAESAEAL